MSSRIAGVLRGLCALALLAWTAGSTPAAQAQNSRAAIALLIANWTYPGDAALTSPEHDAVTIRDALESAGFATEIAPNLQNRADMLAALNAFAAKAAHADKAIVYFAGHGLETGGRYWLVPTSARLTSDTDTARSSVSLDDMVVAVANASRLRVVIIDACRNNRFAANWRQAEEQAADRRVVLRTVVETNDALIAYSAKLGTPALDRVNANDTNSPFAVALAESLAEPGVEASELFKAVSAKVKSATNGVQEPVAFGAGAPAGAQAYFRDPTSDTVRASGERFAWAQASQINSVDSYALYLRDHAHGANAMEAQVRMARHLIDTAKSPPSMDLSLTVDSSEAFEEALKQAAGGKSLHIRLKPGNYASTSSLFSLPSDAGDIMIEGTGATPAATTVASSVYRGAGQRRTWLKSLTYADTLYAGKDEELYTENVVIKGEHSHFQSWGQGRFALVGGAIFPADYASALSLSGTTVGAVSGVLVRATGGRLAQVDDGSRLTVLDRSDLSTNNEDIVNVSDSAAAIFRGNRIAVPYVDDKEPRLTRNQKRWARMDADRPLPAERLNAVFDGNVIRLPRSREAAFFRKHPPSMREQNTIETY